MREDSEINTFNDIFGKRVAVGPRDGGMTQHEAHSTGTRLLV